jgi:hypothetical protein
VPAVRVGGASSKFLILLWSTHRRALSPALSPGHETGGVVPWVGKLPSNLNFIVSSMILNVFIWIIVSPSYQKEASDHQFTIQFMFMPFIEIKKQK